MLLEVQSLMPLFLSLLCRAEGVATILTFLLISGLFFPRYTAALGAVYIFGRVLYGIGYRWKGERQLKHMDGLRAT
jgi:hypothetical protein